MGAELRHKNLYFFDKNGEYLNLSYNDFAPLVEKPFDWDYNSQRYFELDSNNDFVNCSTGEKWAEGLFYQKNDCWFGEIYLDETSTGIFSVQSIIILEKDNLGNYRYPYKKDNTTDSFLCGFTEDDIDEIFMFSYDENYINYTQSALSQEPDGPDLIKANYIQIDLGEQTDITKEAAQLNIALCADEENTFKRTLYIYERNSEEDIEIVDNKYVAIITIYGKTINEDERLKTICENFGYNIIDTDTIAFEKTNIKEILPDWTIINEKRKEIILEGHNIYPYIGAYKGIINAIKYFGYNELQLREFWKNVDPNSPYYGKYVQTDCVDFLSVDNVRFNQPKVTLPSKQYRKTSLFSLVYKINDITEGEYDEDNLPLTHENQDFTQEEILIKLFALKKKLQKDFLPLNARIKDIVGEADFFALNELTNVVSSNIKNNIQVGIAPTFEVVNGEKYNELDDKVYANLIDLRNFFMEYYNSTTNPSKGNPMTFYDASNVFQGLLSWWNMFTSPREQYSLIINGEQVSLKPIMENNSGDNNFNVENLKEVYLAYFNKYCPNIKYSGYWEDGRSSEYLSDIDPLPDNWDFVTNFTLGSGSGSGEGLSYIEKMNENYRIPVGALVILRNTTFDNVIFDNEEKDDTIQSLNATYNELSKADPYEVFTFGLENFVEYGIDDSHNFSPLPAGDSYDNYIVYAEVGDILTLSFSDLFSIEYTTTATDTVKSIMTYFYDECRDYQKNSQWKKFLKDIEFIFDDTENELQMRGVDAYNFDWKIEHPKLDDAETTIESDMRYSVAVSNRKTIEGDLFKWDNIHRRDTVGIEWTIKKDETETSPAFYFNSVDEIGSKDINIYNELPVVLPYIGTYTVEMRLYNMYNHLSSLVKTDYIEVVGREVEFSGWYTAQEESNGFQQVGQLMSDDYTTVSHEDLNKRSKELLNYWMSAATEHRNNEYTWENCKDFKIGEYGSSWDNAIKPETIWDEVTPALYEGLDNANTIENNLIDVDDKNMHTLNFRNNATFNLDLTYNVKESTSHTGSYSWKNCTASWDEAYHKSWDTTMDTGDIPFYIEIPRDFVIENNTSITENDIEVNLSNPSIRIELQDYQKEQFEYIGSGSGEDCYFNYTLNIADNKARVSLENMLTSFKEWISSNYDINFEKYIVDNFVYENGDYIDVTTKFISDKKCYVSISDEYEYYEVVTKNGENVATIRQSSSSDAEVEVEYLKQIEDVEFTKSNGSYKGTTDTITRVGESGHIPIVNWNKLEGPIDTPHYTLNETDTETGEILSTETVYVNPGEMYDVPDFAIDGSESTEKVITGVYMEGLVAWKYYKHCKGYTIYDDKIAIPEYEYFKVVPCTSYKVSKYFTTSHKPDTTATAEKLQLIGKYPSKLFDMFNIYVCYESNEKVYAFDANEYGIIQHNAEIHNPTWNNSHFINSWKALPKLTRICFTYDKCKILGKRNPKWTFKNITTGEEKVIESRYGVYMFKESGNYSITLELEDSNENKYIATKNYLTII